MISLSKLAGHEKLEAPAVIAAVIGAVAAVGAAVYTSNKAEKAADKKSAADSLLRNESQSLREAEAEANSARQQAQAGQRNLANSSATEMQIDAMDNAAESEKAAAERAKLLAAEQPQQEYAKKFKPGTGDTADGTSSDFLVPKSSDNSGLIRETNDTAGSGLVTPLGFKL